MHYVNVMVNGRGAYGEPAKELFVGTFMVSSHEPSYEVFEEAVMDSVTKLNKKKYMLPDERVQRMQEELISCGFKPLNTRTIFAAVG